MSKFNPFTVNMLKTNNEQYGLHVVDVGAAGGVDNPWNTMASVSNTHCYGFEPCQEEFDRLPIGKNLHYFPIAISDETGELDFYALGTRSSLSDSTERTFEKRRVMSDTLDHLRQSEVLPYIDVLKIDVERNEKRVLNGAKRTLSQEVLYVKAEFSFDHGSGNFFSAIDQTLHEAGFFVFQLCTQKNSFGKIKGGDVLFLKNIIRLSEEVENTELLKRRVLNLITIAIASHHIKYAYACIQYSKKNNILSLEEYQEITAYLNQFLYLPTYFANKKRMSKFFKYRRLLSWFFYRISEILGEGFIEKSTPEENRLHPSSLLWYRKKHRSMKLEEQEKQLNEIYNGLALYHELE